METRSRRAVAAWISAALTVCCLGGLWHSAGAAAAVCPNEALRTGPSAALPDCRAYELVSPPDSNGRRLRPLKSELPATAGAGVLPSELASPTGESAVFLAYHSPLPEFRGATGIADVYDAERGTGGWQTTRRLSPSGSQALQAIPGGVSPDHRYSISIIGGGANPLAVEESSTVYLGNPDGSFELLGLGSLGSEPYAQARYLGEGGEHIVFSTGNAFAQKFPQSTWCVATLKCKVAQLEPDAPPTGTGAVYDRSAGGPTHVVSLLPGNVTPAAGEQAFWKGTSKDGSATAFEIEGTLYVRVDDEETLEVAAGEPAFAGLSDEGRYLFYVAGGNIHRFDTQTEADTQVNSTGDAKVVNVSGDGSHVYFISETQIGGEGEASKPNLYVWSGGAPEYVATVAASDLQRTSGELVGTPALTNWTTWVTNKTIEGTEQGPGNDSSRTTPDGSVLVFESKAKLIAYDNAGHTEVYRYDDGEKSLVCVSCNPGFEPATGDARLQELHYVNAPTIIHNVSDDGARIFFESEEALVEGDADGVNDAYEWQEEEGGGGRLGLISSGHSTKYIFGMGEPLESNLLLGVTPSGNDTVFLSQDALVAGAPESGAWQIYDARVNGGFAAPAPPTPCSEEACKPAAAALAPSFGAPASETTQSGGDVKPHRRHHCRRSKRRRHRCARRKAQRRPAQQSGAANSQASEGPQAVAPPSGSSSAKGDGLAVTGSPRLASSPFDEYGIESVGAHESTTAAGMHPDFTTEITFNHTVNESGEIIEPATTEEAAVSLPPGLLGNPNSIPTCTTGELIAYNCPIDSQVGVTRIIVTEHGELTEPVYNLAPPHPEEEAARLGFIGYAFPVFIDVKVRSASDYGVTATVYGTSGWVALVSAKTTLWGNPADSVHDKERLTPFEAKECPKGNPCKAGGQRPSGLPPSAFMTNPSSCQAMSVGFAATSYQLPGQVFTATAPMKNATSCAGLPFQPSFEATPTSRVAGAPTGLKTKLVLPQQSTEAVASPATATMREARVTLPEGMQINPAAANWIAACSEAQVGFHEEVDAACPDASKLGTATIASPDLPEPLHGAIYQRTPSPGHQFGLWLVSDELGLHVKIPGELQPDPKTGRLTAVFSDLPQVPVEEIDLNVWGGPRAPLENPGACGTYAADFTFTPHSEDPPVTGQSQMTIDEGCNQSFSPTLHTGVTAPQAGAYSPLVFDLAREDGEQPLRGFELQLPPGELAKLKGVPLCSETQAPAGACPADSKIGHLAAGLGAGPEALWVPQPGKPEPSVYLAGPYQGSPFSVVSVVPAQAGPFDLGDEVVRSGLTVEPESGRALVKADPLPQFFEGVGLSYRQLHVVIDRPQFALNPTDCRELQADAIVSSTQGTVAHPSDRFQVDGCKALGFKPKLSLELHGGSERGQFPALTATLKARKGDANIGKASVALPRSEFLAQSHIGTICHRPLFAAHKCPKRSVYGYAKAWSPLLAKPLKGPVYLRPNGGERELPDLVARLEGEIEIDLVGFIDTGKSGGIRTRFESVPDAPVSRFVLKMKGGAKGLLENTSNLCLHKHRASASLRAQNGRLAQLRPLLAMGGCGGSKH